MKIFLDSADFEIMKKTKNSNIIDGYTTNPSLMKKHGIVNYMEFVKKVTDEIDLPISFEVFSDDIFEMERQALILHSFGENVYVKIPVINTKGVSTIDLVGRLIERGVKVNLTAVFEIEQLYLLKDVLIKDISVIISVFAGRIADTGIDPILILSQIIDEFSDHDDCDILWASVREIFNFYQAEELGCDIITLPIDLLRKLKFKNKNLFQYSMETVKQFYDDAQDVGYVV